MPSLCGRATKSTFAMDPLAIRSRSRAPSAETIPDFRGAPRPGPPPGLSLQNAAQLPNSQVLLAQLLEQQQTQNQLLSQQVQLLQINQLAMNQAAYTNPTDILCQVDPTLKIEMEQWAKEYRAVLQQYCTQDTLHAKYLDLTSKGELHKQFADEVNKVWQWPAMFKAEVRELQACRPVITEGEPENYADIDPDSDPFDLDAAFRIMRKRHAEECQNFIFAYQRQCLKYYKGKADASFQEGLLLDRFQAWTLKHAHILNEFSRKQIESKVKHFAELTFRTELPKIQSRHEKEKDKRKKQREELLQAEAEFRLMDINKLLAMAMLERSALTGRGQASNRQQVVPPNGALAFFLHQYPDLAKKYNLTTQAEKATKPKPGSDRGRSTSMKSRHSSKGSHRSKSLTKGAGKNKPARQSSRSSSKASKSSNKSKGKGKGKGKQQHGRGRGKMHTKAVRVQTPAPNRH